MPKVRSFFLAGLMLLTARAAAESEIPTVTLGGHQAHATRILARFKAQPSATAPQAVQLLSSLGLSVQNAYALVPGLVSIDELRSPLSRLGAVVVDPDQQAQRLVERIGALRRSGLFAYVEPCYIRYALQPRYEPTDEEYRDGTLWGLRNDGNLGGALGADISAPEAWYITTGLTNVLVAVVDTGVLYNHQELVGQMWRNPNEVNGLPGVDDDGNGLVDDIYGINAYDPQNPTGDPLDFNDHGTHVSGTIGAAANDGFGHVGVAWKVQIMACKFLGGALGSGTSDGAIAAIQYAVTNGAKILNNSWGGGPFSSAELDAIAAARSAGALFVAAAGNNGTDNDVDPSYPANYDLDNVISVAAMTRADDLAVFSQYGLRTVDLGAPGQEIYSCISASPESYASFDGTSMAAPHVSGVAALVRARYPNISLFELRERLLRTTIPVPALDGKCVTGGRVNAYKALVAEGDGDMEIAVTPPPESILLGGSTQAVEVVVTDMFGLTNATVAGLWIDGGAGTVTFLNSGAPPDAVALDPTYTANVVMPVGVSEATLRLVVTAPGKNALTNFVHWLIAEPPTNDDFVNALKLPNAGGVVYSITDFATFELPDEPLHAGVSTVDATLWWNWSPEVSGPALVDTSGSGFDTVLAVYRGPTLDRLTNVVSADNVNGRRQAYVQFDAVAGTTYRIVVGGATTNERGGLRLRIEPNGAPDVLPPFVQILNPGDGLITTTNRVFVSGTATDPRPASGVSQVRLKINNDLATVAAKRTNEVWSYNFLLRPGYNRIYALATDFAFNQSEPVSIGIQYMPIAPANDHFAGAMALTSSVTNVLVDTRQATKEYLEPNHAGNQGGHSVWYVWTAPSDGVLQVMTTNVNFDSLLAVYTGDRVTNLTLVASNDDAINGNKFSKVATGVRAQTTYHIAVDGYGGGVGGGRLVYGFTPGTVFRLTTEADPGGRVAPLSGDYGAGTTVRLVATPDIGFSFSGWVGDVTSMLTNYSLVMDRDYRVRATFGPPTVIDDFETGGFKPGLPYDLAPAGSNLPWQGQSETAAGGKYAVRSGRIGAGQQSAFAFTARFNAGVASFAYRVSSELHFDTLEFLVNNVPLQSWSGVLDTWSVYQFVVAGGTNKLEWRYSKDWALNDGADAAYIDDLILPLAAPDPVAPQLRRLAVDQQVTLQFDGENGRSYTIEASSDLRNWEPVATTAAVNGVVRYSASISASPGARFFRACVE